MIITRTPLRISFVGGGSDVPSFYREEMGATVTAAIDKYVYVTVSDKFDGSIRAAYSVTENVARLDELQHELIRESLYSVDRSRGIEVHSIADIPGGTGLGSSSAFTVGLLRALHADFDAKAAAEAACYIEIGACRHPIGKQDQYATAFGGVNLLQFRANHVTVLPIDCNTAALSDHLLLLYTGQARAGDAGQHITAQKHDRDDIRTLVNAAREFGQALEENNLEHCGGLMNWAWNVKRKYASTPQIDAWYAAAITAGAWGGKLCGAGGGGFLAFLAPPEAHDAIVQATGLRHVPVRLGVPGCEVIHNAKF